MEISSLLNIDLINLIKWLKLDLKEWLYFYV